MLTVIVIATYVASWLFDIRGHDEAAWVATEATIGLALLFCPFEFYKSDESEKANEDDDGHRRMIHLTGCCAFAELTYHEVLLMLGYELPDAYWIFCIWLFMALVHFSIRMSLKPLEAGVFYIVPSVQRKTGFLDNIAVLLTMGISSFGVYDGENFYSYRVGVYRKVDRKITHGIPCGRMTPARKDYIDSCLNQKFKPSKNCLFVALGVLFR